jgi:hypothetical protein
MKIRKMILGCLLLIAAPLLLGAWIFSPPSLIPTCANCRISMSNTSSTVSGTFTYLPRGYNRAVVVLIYANEQQHSMPLPTLNLPFSQQVLSARLPAPVRAEIAMCWPWGTQSACDRVPISIR